MRSFLFVPGDSEKKFAKARTGDADALILDLEDSVAAPAKAAARQTVAAMLDAPREGPALFVRVNALDTGLTLDDLAAIMPHRPDGITLPKCEETGRQVMFDLPNVDVRLACLGRRQVSAKPLMGGSLAIKSRRFRGYKRSGIGRKFEPEGLRDFLDTKDHASENKLGLDLKRGYFRRRLGVCNQKHFNTGKPNVLTKESINWQKQKSFISLYTLCFRLPTTVWQHGKIRIT